jgi:alcohol dehydrogenase YqhD (iron-dependent ADH family)
LHERCLESHFEKRKAGYAESAETVLGIRTGTVEEKARAFIEELQKFIVSIGLPTKVSDWPGVVVGPNDVEELVHGILTTAGAPAVGFQGCYTEADIRAVLTQALSTRSHNDFRWFLVGHVNLLVWFSAMDSRERN